MKRRTFGSFVKCRFCSVALRVEEIQKHESKCHKRTKDKPATKR